MHKQKYTNVRVNEFASDKNLGVRDFYFDLPNVSEMRHEPLRHSFPKRAYGKAKLSNVPCKDRGSRNESGCTMTRRET